MSDTSHSIAKSALIFLVIVAVPTLLAVPVMTCVPVGGELPGINCVPVAALDLLGAWLFAFILGTSLDRIDRFVGSRSAMLVIAGLIVGGLLGQALLDTQPGDWKPTAGGGFLPWTVWALLIAFALGWLLRASIAAISRARAKGRPGAGDAPRPT